MQLQKLPQEQYDDVVLERAGQLRDHCYANSYHPIVTEALVLIDEMVFEQSKKGSLSLEQQISEMESPETMAHSHKPDTVAYYLLSNNPQFTEDMLLMYERIRHIFCQ